MQDVLSEIVAHKKREVARQMKEHPLSMLEQKLSAERIPFYSLKTALEESSTGIIAEFKRRSPSKGWINRSAEATTVVQAYEAAGAAALSVLTDEPYFGGTLDDLRTATKSVSIPVMRKEFIVDEYQIYDAKLSGASAILLIAAAITKEESKRFTELAGELQLEVLLELHDERETEYITPHNRLIGINNRNLGSFVTDVQKSFRMIDLLPREALLISESGISDPQVVRELRDAGYRGFLIGENFMKCDEPGESLRAFLGEIKRSAG
ncbi:indole-3-glycerol phosphate synthase TrpC [Dysgonomonadaceae bacterium zrk40]|nr:indole-3-glycerol phosphate synthase TrpC [Dysgonomonadaceae bacterium zrk40]